MGNDAPVVAPESNAIARHIVGDREIELQPRRRRQQLVEPERQALDPEDPERAAR